MIAANEWWQVLQQYSISVFPAQIVFYMLAAGVLLGSSRLPYPTANRFIKGILYWLSDGSESFSSCFMGRNCRRTMPRRSCSSRWRCCLALTSLCRVFTFGCPRQAGNAV